MPSSRRARKHFRLGSSGAAQRDSVAGAPAPLNKEYVSLAQRQRNVQARAKMAAQFAALSAAQRRERREEFRTRLRAACTSDTEFRGFWSLKMAPLLEGGARETLSPRAEKATPSGRVPVSPTSQHRAADPRATVAIMALVAEHPGVLTQKTCAMVLAGSASPKLREAGLDRASLFG